MATSNRTGSMKFVVLDAGARFGIHESWVGYDGPLNYFLFEPDPEEVARLKEKYKGNAALEVIGNALGDKDGEIVLNQLKHRGGISVLTPDYSSRYWKDVRPTAGIIESTFTVKSTTIDGWCTQRNLELDFCKIDVEGSEVAVIQGGEQQLRNNVLGVRAEVLFNSLYRDQVETFSDINKTLISYGFTFLNFEKNFSNSQIPYSDLHIGEKFGQLIGGDALWVKPPESVLSTDKGAINPCSVLKLAYFAMRNGATDLGMSLLTQSADKGVPMVVASFSDNVSDSKEIIEQGLFELEREVAKLLFALRDVPRYDASYLSSVFEKIFKKSWVGPGEYYIRYPLRA
jgi:FkbM family methyltransferase